MHSEVNTNFFIIQKRFRRKSSRRLFSQFGLTKFSKCELCINLQKSREWRKLKQRQQFLPNRWMSHSFKALCSQNILCFSTEPPFNIRLCFQTYKIKWKLLLLSWTSGSRLVPTATDSSFPTNNVMKKLFSLNSLPLLFYEMNTNYCLLKHRLLGVG